MTTLKSRLPIIFLLFGAVLRIVTLGSAALWYDEAISLYRTNIPFMQLFTNRSDYSGALLLDLLLRPIMAIDPRSLWLLRLPSLLAGMISLWLVWKLMQRLQFTWMQQCLVAAFVAFLPGLLWMGQDARPYGLLACLFLAAIWFALEKRWLGMLACCGLMIYCQSTGAVYALGALAIALYLYPQEVRRILINGGLAMLAWIPAIIHILQNGGSLNYAWGTTPTLEIWWISGFAAAWTKIPTDLFFAGSILLLMTFCLLLSGIKAHGRIIPLLAWGVPLVGMMLFSIYRNVIIYRTLMPLLFPFMLWLGWELGNYERQVLLRIYLAGTWIVLLLVGLSIWRPADRGGNLDQFAAQIRAQWQPGDQLVFATGTVWLPFDYYLGDLPQAWLHIVQDPILKIPDIPHIAQPCQGPCKREWVIIPDEKYLITPAEWASLKSYMQGQPVYSIHYMQAAAIDVYLKDVK